VEPTLYIGRNYVLHAHISDNPDAINDILERVSNIQHALGLSKRRVTQAIYLAGLAKLEEEIEAGRKGTIPQRGTSEWDRWVIAKKRASLLQDQAKWKALEPIYSELGPEEFVEWAEREGLDIAPFLEKYTWRCEDLKTSERDKDFVVSFLDRQGGAAGVEEIRKAALEAQIIENVNGDWQRFEKNAERSGIRKDYGKWSLPR
jgi:hypothetical protein